MSRVQPYHCSQHVGSPELATTASPSFCVCVNVHQILPRLIEHLACRHLHLTDWRVSDRFGECYIIYECVSVEHCLQVIYQHRENVWVKQFALWHTTSESGSLSWRPVDLILNRWWRFDRNEHAHRYRYVHGSALSAAIVDSTVEWWTCHRMPCCLQRIAPWLTRDRSKPGATYEWWQSMHASFSNLW